MKKERTFRIAINALGILCAGLIMLAGVLLPAVLLKKLERDNLVTEWPEGAVVIDALGAASETGSDTGESPDTETNSGRLRAIIAALHNNPSYPRDPLNGELLINEAVERARIELDLLIALRALPDFGPDDYGFFSAELSEIGAGQSYSGFDPLGNNNDEFSLMGVWHVTFANGDERVYIWLDALTGKALGVVLASAETGDSTDINESLLGFASYYFKGADTGFSGHTDGCSSACLKTAGLKLSLDIYKKIEADNIYLLVFDISADEQSGSSEPENIYMPEPTASAAASEYPSAPAPTRPAR